MNFVHVKVEGSGDEARLKGGAFDAPIPPKLRQAVGAISDRQLVMGVRPEHFDIGEPNRETGSVRASVDVVEYLGNEELLHIRADEQYLVAVVDSNLRVRGGDVLDLVFTTDHMYLFDNETGESLTESALATPT
jgi:multiple sugar transport system ATP-binding protein